MIKVLPNGRQIDRAGLPTIGCHFTLGQLPGSDLSHANVRRDISISRIASICSYMTPWTDSGCPFSSIIWPLRHTLTISFIAPKTLPLSNCRKALVPNEVRTDSKRTQLLADEGGATCSRNSSPMKDAALSRGGRKCYRPRSCLIPGTRARFLLDSALKISSCSLTQTQRYSRLFASVVSLAPRLERSGTSTRRLSSLRLSSLRLSSRRRSSRCLSLLGL
jgi:hypothetical protein